MLRVVLRLAALAFLPVFVFSVLLEIWFWAEGGRALRVPFTRIGIGARMMEDARIALLWLPALAVVCLVQFLRLRRNAGDAFLSGMLYALSVFACYCLLSGCSSRHPYLGWVVWFALFSFVSVPPLAMWLLPDDAGEEDAGSAQESDACNRCYGRLLFVFFFCAPAVSVLTEMLSAGYMEVFGSIERLFSLMMMFWMIGVLPATMTACMAVVLGLRRNIAGICALVLCGLCFAMPVMFVLCLDGEGWFGREAAQAMARSAIVVCLAFSHLLPPAHWPQSAYGIGSRKGRRTILRCCFVVAPLLALGAVALYGMVSPKALISPVTGEFSVRMMCEKLLPVLMAAEGIMVLVAITTASKPPAQKRFIA